MKNFEFLIAVTFFSMKISFADAEFPNPRQGILIFHSFFNEVLFNTQVR